MYNKGDKNKLANSEHQKKPPKNAEIQAKKHGVNTQGGV